VPPFALRFTTDARDTLAELEKRDVLKVKKVRRTLARLEQDPRHPGLHTHKYHGISAPDGGDAWQSYVENRTPGAWRILWFYGPESDMITVLRIGPHPD
jgi:hypothetical protein